MNEVIILLLAGVWTGGVLVIMTLLWAYGARQAGASSRFDSGAGVSECEEGDKA